MRVESTHEIERLVSWGGAWASKALFDDAVYRHINGLEQDRELAWRVAEEASGMAAARHLSNYTRLTGIAMPRGVPCDIRKETQSLLDLNRVARLFPEGSLSELWVGRLCEHLRSSRKGLTSGIQQILQSEVEPNVDYVQLFKAWSVPLLRSIIPFPDVPYDIHYIESDEAALCWRRWHRTTGGIPVLFEAKNKTGLKVSQWLVWRLIHDATHLIHLSCAPELDATSRPEQLAMMEAVAMAGEVGFLELISEDSSIIVPSNYAFHTYNIKTILLLGLAERALRLDYDLAVHGHNQPIDDWITVSSRRTGLAKDFFEFANEFHGMPGFSAAYMTGLEAFRATPDKARVLSGSIPLELLKSPIEDDFSRSPTTDIPSRRPQHAIYLGAVGTKNVICRFKLLDPFTGEAIETLADATLSVSLDSRQRGIHMSRLQQIVEDLDERIWESLPIVTDFLARRIKEVQASDSASVTLKTQMLVDTRNNISDCGSNQPLTISASSAIDNDRQEHSVSLSVKVMTACPCTLEYSKLRAQENIKAVLQYHYQPILKLIPPTFTHSQPGDITVSVYSEEKPLSVKTIYGAIASVGHLVESVLKRPDEHAFIEKVHLRPQFCEDICRDVAVSVASGLKEDDIVEITVEMAESIHPHKVFARLRARAVELWNQ